jgi:catechol 2,3-dioxygenase-like lactoylglutathione lyase family enzyme
MSIMKARDVSHVRFRAPDLDRMRGFLQDFGMLEASSEPDVLYMRGYGATPFVHVTERGDPGFVGFGIWAPDEESLLKLAQSEGLEPARSDAPGGGLVLRLTDPDGNAVEVLSGQATAEALPIPEHLPWNQGGQYPRENRPRRVGARPSHVLRLGHVVMAVRDFATSEQWYKERFGLLTSDEIRPAGADDRPIGAFLRCDRGDDPCDHHTIFLVERPEGPGFVHSAFEIVDFDDLMSGHDYLSSHGREHFWGIGRHFLGSQVFDYWKDPWGHEIEHWTDGDKLAASRHGGFGTIQDLLGVQWGMAMPAPFAPPPDK